MPKITTPSNGEVPVVNALLDMEQIAIATVKNIVQ